MIDEIIIGERYDHLVEDLAGLPFDLVVLAPRAEVVWKERDASRGQARRARREVGDLPRRRVTSNDGRKRRLDRQLRSDAGGNGSRDRPPAR